MMNLGDFTTSETIYVPFATYDSNGASVTITGLAVTDIEIYKDGSTTQRSSDAGYALLDTDGIDFDGATGIHGFSVDLSDDTDTGFYASGSQFWLVVNAITVDSQTVRFVYYFTIGRYLKPTTSGRTLDVTTGGAAGIDWGNVENPSTSVNLSATITNLCNTITTYTGNTVQTGDAFSRLGAPAGASVSADVAAVKAETASIVADTNELQTDWTDGGRLDLIIDAILVDTGTTLDAKIDTIDGIVDTILVDTGTTLPATLATIDGIVDAILLDTAEIGAAGAGLTDLGGMSASMQAEVNAEVVDVITVDTIAELGSVPSSTPTLAVAAMLPYMALRNKIDVTASAKEIHNDAGTVIVTKTLSDDGTTYSETKGA